MRYETQGAAVKAVEFSACGHYIFIAAEGNIRMYNRNTGALFRNFKGHNMRINSIKVSQENNIIVSGSDDKFAIVWN